jgi:hypothetical protein
VPALDLPYHAQTADFSCGAACLASVIAARDGAKPHRDLEFELWREANMIGVRGIDQWGLAIPALARGLEATVVSGAEHTFPREDHEEAAQRIRERLEETGEDDVPHFTPQDLELSWYAQQRNRERAREAGVRWLRRRPRQADVASAVEQGAAPVLLVDLETLSGTWPAPHWVVVDAVDGDRVRVLDPDMGEPGRRTLPWRELEDAMDVSRYEAQPCAVVLGSWSPTDET